MEACGPLAGLATPRRSWWHGLRGHVPPKRVYASGVQLLLVRVRAAGLNGGDAPRGSPSRALGIGALYGAVVFGYEVELDAAVLFDAGAYGPLHHGCGEASRQGEGVATQVLGEGKAE